MPLSILDPPKLRPSQVETPPLSNLDPYPSQIETRTTLNRPEPPLRKRDPIWDALVLLEGEPTTKSERGRLNAAAKELRDAHVDPATIATAAAAYRKEWPGVTLTANALVANWSRFCNGSAPAAKNCPHCGPIPSSVRLSDHLANVHGERIPA